MVAKSELPMQPKPTTLVAGPTPFVKSSFTKKVSKAPANCSWLIWRAPKGLKTVRATTVSADKKGQKLINHCWL